MKDLVFKQCGHCKQTKPIEDFHKDKSTKSGYASCCKLCCKEKSKEIREKFKDKLKEKRKEYDKKYLTTKRSNRLESTKKYYQKNKEKLKNVFKEYRNKNKQKRSDHEKERKKNDSIYRFVSSVRSNILYAFKRRKLTKKLSSKNILGCSMEFFIEYIKSKFTEGMNMDNYGEWHLDHIIPLATANTEEEVLKLCHYTNYQPLWAEDNISKHAKVPKNVQFKLL